MSLLALAVLAASSSLPAEEPYVSYIFPAGGQQGTTVDFKVGGHYLHGEASFEMPGPGVEAGPRIRVHMNVFVDGHRAQLDSLVGPGSTIHVIPAVSGG